MGSDSIATLASLVLSDIDGKVNLGEISGGTTNIKQKVLF